MSSDDKNTLLIIGGAVLLGWLFSRKHGKCPKCNYPVTSKNQNCPNCGQYLDWRRFE